MPKIANPDVIEILKDHYFVQHTAMHLSRGRVTLPDGKTKLRLILPPCVCGDCSKDGKMAGPGKASPMAGMSGAMADDGSGGMIEAGEKGSGRQLLEMHHQMIRVLRFLLEHHQPPLRFLAEWRDSKWCPVSDPDDSGYAPQFWNLDDPGSLPHEIVGMFLITDPDYLDLVFAGVKRLIEPNNAKVDDAVDELGRFIEQGVKSGPPDGSGFHDTMHAYLAAREGRAAQGAEMNKLNDSRFNDYFWSLHLWIDSQYGRLLERRGQVFDTSALDPKTLDMCTAAAAGGKAPGMVMAT
jgi:hypothetical protein